MTSRLFLSEAQNPYNPFQQKLPTLLGGTYWLILPCSGCCGLISNGTLAGIKSTKFTVFLFSWGTNTVQDAWHCREEGEMRKICLFGTSTLWQYWHLRGWAACFAIKRAGDFLQFLLREYNHSKQLITVKQRIRYFGFFVCLFIFFFLTLEIAGGQGRLSRLPTKRLCWTPPGRSWGWSGFQSSRRDVCTRQTKGLAPEFLPRTKSCSARSCQYRKIPRATDSHPFLPAPHSIQPV